MKIGLTGDTHGSMQNLRRVIAAARRLNSGCIPAITRVTACTLKARPG